MAMPKFESGAKVRVTIEGKTRNGRVASVNTSTKRGRRTYEVVADYKSRPLGTFRSDELLAR